MKCTGKERETCNEEKMGCEGCYYNTPNNKDTKVEREKECQEN